MKIEQLRKVKPFYIRESEWEQMLSFYPNLMKKICAIILNPKYPSSKTKYDKITDIINNYGGIISYHRIYLAMWRDTLLKDSQESSNFVPAINTTRNIVICRD